MYLHWSSCVSAIVVQFAADDININIKCMRRHTAMSASKQMFLCSDEDVMRP